MATSRRAVPDASAARRMVLATAVILLLAAPAWEAAAPGKEREKPQVEPGGVQLGPVPSGSGPTVSAEEGPLVAEGPAPDLIFLYTGRAIGFVEPCG